MSRSEVVVTPQTWRGAGANAAVNAASSLQQQRTGIGEADRAVFPTIEAARAADAESRLRLTQIRREISVGVAALRPSMDTPAGRRQLIEFLDAKAAEARRVNENAQRDSSRVAAELATLGGEYEAQTISDGREPASTTDGENRDGAAPGEPKTFMASWGPRPLSPADPEPPAPEPSGSVPADIGSLMLPPPPTAAPPIPDATRKWVDDMTAALASRPPDDPIAVEARRLAYLALNQPQSCDGWEWTSSAGGLAVAAIGTGVTALGAPAGPADWALLGASLAGTGLAYTSLLKCISQAAVG